MGKIIYRPSTEVHKCKPFMDRDWIRAPETRSTEPIEIVPPLGTIWRCGCGRLWKAVKQPYSNVLPNRMWKRAGWWTVLRVWWKLI